MCICWNRPKSNIKVTIKSESHSRDFSLARHVDIAVTKWKWEVRELFPFGQRAAGRVPGTGVSVFSAHTDVFVLTLKTAYIYNGSVTQEEDGL